MVLIYRLEVVIISLIILTFIMYHDHHRLINSYSKIALYFQVPLNGDSDQKDKPLPNVVSGQRQQQPNVPQNIVANIFWESVWNGAVTTQVSTPTLLIVLRDTRILMTRSKSIMYMWKAKFRLHKHIFNERLMILMCCIRVDSKTPE